MLKTIQLNVKNVETMLRQPADVYETILFDPNLDCNLQCVYCHIPRLDGVVKADALRQFIEQNVIRVNQFQVGCAMEPTLDPRLGDLMLMISRSPAKPVYSFRLQTNGTLLKRHDPGKFRDAGLSEVTVSIDSADPEVQKALRGGTSLAEVAADLEWFQKACPLVVIKFITTVTTKNVNGMADLIDFGINLGVTRFVFREMFYYPNNRFVDHSRMPALVLPDGAFSRMKECVSAKFGGRVRLHFWEASTLVDIAKTVLNDSLMPGPSSPPLG